MGDCHVTAMPPDAVIEARLRAMGATVGSWSNGPGDRYAAHAHDFDKVLVVVSGAITFVLPSDGVAIGLGTGDRLDLPSGTSHAATVGAEGVRCLEAHLPAAGLGSPARRVAGWAFGAAAGGTQPATETADRTGT